MTDTTYNGWTNYATWRVNLEIFDGIEPREWFKTDDQYEMSKQLKDFAEELVTGDAGEGLAADYALAFMADVNWYEIAGHLIQTLENA
jgi:hypothetical protein